MVIFLTFITHKYTLAICSVLSLNEHGQSKAKHARNARCLDYGRKAGSCCRQLYMLSAVGENMKSTRRIHSLYACLNLGCQRRSIDSSQVLMHLLSFISLLLPAFIHYPQKHRGRLKDIIKKNLKFLCGRV
jgi:hypothetical protein